MKKFTKIIIALIMVIASVLTVSACQTVDSISVKTAPQTTYLVGQNLNLTGGELTAVTNNGEEVISMTSSDVSVSGYNAQQKGTQTLTVSYKNASTTLEVKVVDRVTAENYNKDYFVGDTFDTSAGRIRITRDNGSSYTVAISDEKVTFGEITATQAGESTVTVDYVNGTVAYSGEVAITVHDVEDMQFVKPTKISYFTHDDGINLAGGYITLIGNDGELEKDIPLTKATVSGFDLSAVTKADKGTPVTQKVSLSYGGETFTYDVKITYTDVNEIKANAQSFAGYEWEGAEMPEYTAEEGEKAIETVKMFSELDEAHKSLITEDELLAVSRLAYAHAFDKWYADSENYKSTFKLNGDGIAFVCKDKALVEADLAVLAGDCDFYKYGEVIMDVIELFPENVLGLALADKVVIAFYGQSLLEFGEDYIEFYEAMNFGDCPYVNIDTFKSDVLPLLQFSVKLANAVPAACTPDNVNEYKAQLDSAFDLIKNSAYTDPQFSQYYYGVSAWREKDDLAEILFAYLYADDVNTEGMNLLANVMLPNKVYEMYETVMFMVEYAAVMQLTPSEAMEQGALVYDSSEYVYYYSYLKEMEENFKSGAYGEMNKHFYDNVLLNGWFGVDDGGDYLCTNLIDEMTYSSGGYYTMLGSCFGMEKSVALLDQYAEIVGKLLPETPSYDSVYPFSSQYGTDIENLFNAFVNLSPAEQSGFICVLNVYYEYKLPEISFDQMTERKMLETIFGDTLENVLAGLGYTGSVEDIFGTELNTTYYMTEFARVIVEYYKDKLTTINLDKAFHNLLRAIEYYTLRYSYDDAHYNFIKCLGEVATAYDTVFTDAERAEFDDNFKTIYNKYLNLAKIHEEGYEVTYLGDWADDFALLEQAAQTAVEAYAALQSGEIAASALYIASEKVNAIVNDILKNAPADVLYAFNYEPILEYTYEYTDPEGNSEMVTINYTGDFFASYVRYTLNEVTSIIDMHGVVSDEVNAFFALAYDVTFANAFLPEGETIAKQTIVDTMKAFDTLSAIDKEVFYVFDIYSGSDYPFYTLMLMDYFASVMSEEAAKVANDFMMELQTACVFYENSGSVSDLEELKLALEKVTTAYGALSDSDKESFEFIYEIYSAWVDKCEQMIADAENQ